MEKEKFYSLLDKYLSGEASKEEEQLLLNFYGSFKSSKELDNSEMKIIKDKIFNKISERINADVESESFIKKYYLKSISIAAMVLISVSLSFLFLRKNDIKKEDQFVEINSKNDILPGNNKAVLTLADGSRISLDDAEKGLLASQGNIAITKTDKGEIVYEKNNVLNGNNLVEKSAINTIETPNGGKFQVRLPDGSKVWLNSASSLSYPTVFAGKERKVVLKGEAYFEIAPNKQLPFRVVTNDQIVEVLGTHFNINSYDDEDFTKTTLLEGSVRVTLKSNLDGLGKTKMLKPGEQSLTNSNNSRIRVENADTEKAIAWKNGYFKFKNTPIKEIMREVERWYDVELVYEGEIPTDEFTGFISNDVNISAVLKILEQSGGVKFTVKGKKIKVKTIQ